MSILIRKDKEFWQRKPSGLIELSYENCIAPELDLFVPFDGTVLAHGGLSLGDPTLESSGSDTEYLQWADDGLENSIYDGVYSDGMGVRTQLRDDLVYSDRLVGAQIRSVGGNFISYNFVIGGDNWDDSLKSCRGTRHNGIAVAGDGTDIHIEVAARSAIFAGALIRDGLPHTYIAHVSTPSTREVSLFIDGVLFGTQSVGVASFKVANEFNFGAGDWQNRGLNGVVNSCFYINGKVDIGVAKSLSENPYQVVKKRRKYWVMPSGATSSAPIMASVLRGA